MKGAGTRRNCTTALFWEHPFSQGNLPHLCDSNKTPALRGWRQEGILGITIGKQAEFGVDFNSMILIVIYFIRTFKHFSTEWVI